MHRHSASSAAAQPPEASVRRGFSRSFPRLRALASTLASIISEPLRREERRKAAQDQALGNIALLQARKAVLAHQQNELRAELAAGRFTKDRPASLIRAELRAVTTEILSIG